MTVDPTFQQTSNRAGEETIQSLDHDRAVERLKDVRERLIPCRSPFWARDGHSQTILANYLPSQGLTKEVNESAERVDVTLEREDEQIVSTYLKGRSKNVLYLFHGLGGYSHAFYMQRTAHVAQKLGYHVLMNNHRGCGEGVGLAVDPYHSGRSEDLSAVIAFGKNKLPGHRHIAAGFSLSANALLLLAAGQRADVLPDAAIAVNGPINLEGASRNLSSGVNLVYSYNFMLELRASLAQREKSGRLDRYYVIPPLATIRDFDEIYTAPAAGFRDRTDYYQQCSAAQYLGRIKIPTVLLTAENDPFVDAVDYRTARLSDQAVLHIEETGGHMGYLSRDKTPLGTHRWLDYALKEYLSALMV